MVRVRDIDVSLDFYCTKFGLVEMRRKDVPAGRFTLIFLAAPKDMQSSKAGGAPELELTFNWDLKIMIMAVILAILPIRSIISTKNASN
jgi:lactoylglutathione lyase